MTAAVQFKKKTGLGLQGAWRQDKTIGSKTLVVK
jgi:hypothetical protein